MWRCGPLSVLIPSVCPQKGSTPEGGPRALETMLLFTSMKLSLWLSTTHVGQEMNSIIINIETVQKLCPEEVWGLRKAALCLVRLRIGGRFGGIMGPHPAQMINEKQRWNNGKQLSSRDSPQNPSHDLCCLRLGDIPKNRSANLCRGSHAHGWDYSSLPSPHRCPNLPTQRGGPLRAHLAFREVLLEIQLWGLPSGNLS